MKCTTTSHAMALNVGIALSACDGAETATDSTSSFAPSDVTRGNKAKRPTDG